MARIFGTLKIHRKSKKCRLLTARKKLGADLRKAASAENFFNHIKVYHLNLFFSKNGKLRIFKRVRVMDKKGFLELLKALANEDTLLRTHCCP